VPGAPTLTETLPARRTRTRLLRIERHELGPRCYLAGRRMHECFVGLAVLLLSGVAALLRLGVPQEALVLTGATGAWMVAKDWRDFFPSLRDSAAWSAGIHRRRLALRTVRRGDRLPALLGALAALAGVLNVTSVLTPDLADRIQLLRTLVPGDLVSPAHTLALPAGAALVVVAFYLARRRRRACVLATGLLLALGALDLLKGLDFEEAAASWAIAGLLIWARGAFYVRGRPGTRRTALRFGPLLVGAPLLATLLAIWAARADTTPAPGWASAAREATGLLTLTGGPLRFTDDFHWLPAGVGLLGIGTMVVLAALVFRPLAPPAPELGTHGRARRLLHLHGADTLSYFKLRSDIHHLFSPGRRAFLGYRVEGGTLIVAGEPVGPPEALPALVRRLFALAELHGLRVAVLGAGREHLELWRQAGLRALYLGDEAIVDTAAFSLAGRAIRKVRQSVARLEREGYRTEVTALGSLDPAAIAALEAVSARWRDGAPERGFSMALDALDPVRQPDSVVLVARDADGLARGFLQFVPCYGRRAMSLAAMRRDRDTPNGLTEFMVARAIAQLRDQGIAELSLNFAVLARLLHRPRGPVERTVGALGRLAGTRYQIESLYRFNAKFLPRWEPRYLLHEGALALPRATLAALWAEGHLPKITNIRLRRTAEHASST